MLFGVSPLDLVSYLGVISLLSAVALLACSVPAWRAARVDPANCPPQPGITAISLEGKANLTEVAHRRYARTASQLARR